jgi:type II secretory pathway component PulM
MVNEFFEELMEWDFRILRTLPAFLFLPGRLTNAYVQGQRRRYVRPLRLYLFTSFLLFTVLAFQSIEGLETVESEQAVAEAERALREARLDAQGSDADSLSAAASTTAAVDSQTLDVARRTMAAQGMSGDQIRSIQQMALQEAQKGTQTAREALRRIMNDSLQRPDNVPIDAINWREQAARTLETGDNDELRINIGVADSTTNEQVESMLRTNGARALRNPKEFVSSMVDKGAYLMFVLLPVFAFLLKLAYVRQGRLFAEHFIFTIHIHAFTFLMFACGALLGETSAPWLSDAAFWIACSPLLYAPVAMQRVYGQGFVKTGLKTLFVFTAYSIVLCIGLVLLAVATVFLL